MPHNVSGCKYHNNTLLILEYMHRSIDFVPLHLDDFIDLCVCNESNQSCALNECRICKDGKLFDKNVMRKVSNADVLVQWYEWTEDDGG